ncbi:MAG: thioredoxin family protein [Opitutaceae bacterium]
MNKKSLVLCSALLALMAGCSRSGMVDGTGSATTSVAVPANAAPKSATPPRIAHGQQVDIKAYLSTGRTTIFDFTSEYCPPCRAIAPYLHKLHATRPDIAVVEVDINRPGVQGIDWASPVAQQYGLQSIPHFKVFGPDGRLQAEGQEASVLVRQMLQKLP